MSLPLRLNVPAPDFDLDGVADGRRTRTSLATFRGRWLVLFFYPADFTFVCPTEIRGFQQRLGDFKSLGVDIVGVSVDSLESHEKWASELGGISFPLLSDPDRTVAKAFAVLNDADQRAFRATVVINPEGRIAYFVVSPMNVGRSVAETHRVVQALQTERLCPADWTPGQDTLDPSLQY